MISTFSVPTKLVYGLSSIDKIGEEVKGLNASRAMIVTDQGVMKSGVVERIRQLLENDGITVDVFDQVEANPTIECINKASKYFDEYKGDLLVGIGGGSSIDSAKGVAFTATNPGEIKEYEGADKLKNPTLPVVAVPTTAGTGAEVTGSVVITDTARNYKISVRSPLNVPNVAILDASLMAGLPRQVAAVTGMDALSHAIEAYTTTIATPVTDALAIGAIEMISNNLRKFVARRDNLEAGNNMIMASTMAAMAFMWARVATVHAMAHTLGGHFNISHGLACAILMPHVMEFSLGGNIGKYADIAAAMGEPLEGLSPGEAAAKAVEAVSKLNRDIGIPQKLSDAGVSEDKIESMTRDAISSGICAFNAAETNQDDVKALFERAL